MRPRVFPAEDHTADMEMRIVKLASMRPRVFPAEDVDYPGGLLMLEPLQ